MSCPSSGRLERYVLAMLEPEPSYAVQAHLRRCDICRDRMTSFNQVQTMLEAVVVGHGVDVQAVTERVLHELPPVRERPRSPWVRPLVVTLTVLVAVGWGAFFLGRELGVVGVRKLWVREVKSATVDGDETAKLFSVGAEVVVDRGGWNRYRPFVGENRPGHGEG